MRGHFGADLNLTDAQKQQARAIFKEARQSSQAVQQQLKQSREALAAAVKAGAPDAEIDRLTSSMSPLLAQSMAIHTKAFAKFYATLTPEQKTKVGDKMGHMMSGGFGGPGRGFAAQGWRGRHADQSDKTNQ
jgi:Spy/CpxP family protein refolding chaperone